MKTAMTSCDTVFLLGSGIVTNSWVPVIAAINDFYPHAQVTTNAQANFWLAWWVYHQRARTQPMHVWQRRDERDNAARRRELQANDLTLRETIVANIQVAIDSYRDGYFFRLRRSAEALLKDKTWGAKVFLTTNWDRLLEWYFGETQPVVHIHGDVRVPSRLYLPTETSSEPYRDLKVNEHLRALTAQAQAWIHSARQLCIVGLSLSPLDAELSAILGTSLKRPREPFPVYICDLAEAIDEIEWRVRASAHPAASLDIRRVVFERKKDPRVPRVWW